MNYITLQQLKTLDALYDGRRFNIERDVTLQDDKMRIHWFIWIYPKPDDYKCEGCYAAVSGNTFHEAWEKIMERPLGGAGL